MILCIVVLNFQTHICFHKPWGKGSKIPLVARWWRFLNGHWPGCVSLYQSYQMCHRSPVSSFESRVTRLEYRPNGLVIVIFAVWTNIFKLENTLIHSAQYIGSLSPIWTNTFGNSDKYVQAREYINSPSSSETTLWGSNQPLLHWVFYPGSFWVFFSKPCSS